MKAKVVYIESSKARRINEILAAEKEFKEQGNKWSELYDKRNDSV